MGQILQTCGASVRTGDLFGNKSMLTIFKSSVKGMVKGMVRDRGGLMLGIPSVSTLG